MKRVIMTGATGMIASAVIRKCIQEKVHVIAIVRPNSKKMHNLPKSEYLTFYESDISELAQLKGKIKEKCDVFYHFAWDGTYGSSRDDAYLQMNNVKYTLEAVDLAHELGCSAFIGAGSQAEYGKAEGKLSDTTPVNPLTGYGIAKYTAGKLSKLHAEQLGMKHIWTRILSVYGPGDNDFTMVMSSIRKMLLGEHAAFTKGEQHWDYIHCDDAANAFFLLGESGKHGSVYPIGSGTTKFLHEYITIMRDCISKDIMIGLGEVAYQPNQVMELCADITKLTADTGFTPQIPFEEGIKETIEWFKENRLS